MEDKEIVRRINRFPYWMYPFDLKGHLTPIPKNWDSYVIYRNRPFKRKKYIFDPVVELLGGSLRGKRVLDLGCNAGFWSLCAIEEEADFVLGIDARQMFIEQANFVFEAKEVDKSKYNFIAGNILDIDFSEFGTFDIALCFGLLYHMNKPISLIEKIAKANNDILVLDTRVSNTWGSHMEILFDYEGPDSYVDYKLVMRPTKRAVFDIVKLFGYSAVMLKPPFTDYEGVWDYRWERRAFLCAKKTNLSKLSPELVEDINSRGERVRDFLRRTTEAFKMLRCART